ncbi:carbon storage regulator [Gimesia benthica]|uniref:Translational regulator CsrA n=1 Tax=Gimesia benthica TaxID=2608982 RepID=A0A6I6A6H7_9PLAN|nr:carbon storage regulator [Gimesia benthica]QGQ22014.1 carbon storage regulator [Gimesia benthica]
MLVLTRKRGERVVISDNIELTVVSIRGKRVKLGVTAPADVIIRRNDLSQSGNRKALLEESCPTRVS